jgi:hypothetical protein
MTTRNILVVVILLLVFQNHLGSCNLWSNTPQGGNNVGYIACSSTPLVPQTETIEYDLVSNRTTICNATDLENDSEHITLGNLPTRSTPQTDMTECSGENANDYDYTKIVRQHPSNQRDRSSVGDTVQEPIQLVACEDASPNCAFWAESGECRANPTYMHQKCRKSCRKCGSDLDGPGNRYVQ